MFQLFAITPRYDFRDAIVGSQAVAHPYNFLTVEGARAIALIKSAAPWNDDVAYVVVRLGESPYSAQRAPLPRSKGFDYDAAMDDITF